MTEAQAFYYGGATFPLTASTARSLLRDADPAVYYSLEFFKQVITTHLGTRLLAETAAVGASHITSAVAETLPVDPEQFLTEEHARFPLLTLHRKGTTYRYVNRRRAALHKMELAYVLPPLSVAEAERLIPVLHAVGLIIDQKTVQGLDPAYTPSAPTGTAGEFVWSYARAGIKDIKVKESSIGAYAVSNDLYFPAIVMSLEMDEMGDMDDSQYEPFQGGDVEIDLQTPDGTKLEAVDDFNTYQAPTITSILPTSGTSAGGTSVTLTGTHYRVGTRPIVLFDGAAADQVAVVSATTITCRTPPHSAYSSFLANVMVIAADGQSGSLDDAFTFNAP